LKDLEGGNLKYETAEEFLTELKQEFKRGEEELEQEGTIIEEFVQEFK